MAFFHSLKKLETRENDLNYGEHTSQLESKAGLSPLISSYWLLTISFLTLTELLEADPFPLSLVNGQKYGNLKNVWI